jgi:hypothetical protein
MDWLKARSFRRLGSIRATLRVGTDDELADGELADGELGVELEPQAAAVSATAVPRMSMTGRHDRWCFMAPPFGGLTEG